MTVEDDVRKNSDDIHTLTVNVTRLATIVENSEKRHDSDFEMMKEAVKGISRLNERITATVSMEKDIAEMRGLIAEQKGDVRTIRHDLNNALNSLNGIGILGEKLNDATSAIAAQGAKIEALETWRNKLDGAGGALRLAGSALWALVGSGVVALGYFAFRQFFGGGGNVGL